MRRFRIIAAQTNYYCGVVEVESREALDELCPEDDMDLQEYDGTAMEVVEIEEIKS